MNDLVKQMKQSLSDLKRLSETDSDEAVKISKQNLIQSGIIDIKGELTPPYNSEKINEIDFTMRSKEIQYTKRR